MFRPARPRRSSFALQRAQSRTSPPHKPSLDSLLHAGVKLRRWDDPLGEPSSLASSDPSVGDSEAVDSSPVQPQAGRREEALDAEMMLTETEPIDARLEERRWKEERILYLLQLKYAHMTRSPPLLPLSSSSLSLEQHVQLHHAQLDSHLAVLERELLDHPSAELELIIVTVDTAASQRDNNQPKAKRQQKQRPQPQPLQQQPASDSGTMAATEEEEQDEEENEREDQRQQQRERTRKKQRRLSEAK